MFFSTRRIPTKWIVIILTVVVIVIAGYYWGESQLNYHFTGSREIAPLNAEVRKIIDYKLATTPGEKADGPVDVKEVIEFSNKIVADRLVYDYNVSCYDPNVAWEKRKVNCTGYAALQVAILNYIFKKYADGNWRAEWHAGKVFFGNEPLGALAKYFPKAYKGWKGGHAYPVVYSIPENSELLPDACFYDLFEDAWIVSKEER